MSYLTNQILRGAQTIRRNSSESNKNTDSGFNKNMTTDTPRIETITIKINDGWVTMRDESKEEFVRQLHFERLKREKAEADVERLRSTMRSFILVSPIEFERMEKIEAEVERLKDRLNDCLSFVAFHGPVGATPDTAKLLEMRILATLKPTEK